MRKKGFTLVELLVVIAIIAVLLAILLPSLNNVRNLAQRVICGTRLNNISKGLNLYVATYDSLPLWESKNTQGVVYMHHYTALKRNNNFGNSRRDIPSGYYWMGVGGLVGAGIVDSPRAFYCPATEGWREEIASQPQPWGAVELNSNGTDKNPLRPKVERGYLYWPMSKSIMTQAEFDSIPASDAKRAWSEPGTSTLKQGLPKGTEDP